MNKTKAPKMTTRPMADLEASIRRTARETTAIGTVHTLKYGTAEIVGFDGTWRAEIYRPFEVSPSEPWNREIRERVMAVDKRDATPRHDKAAAYDSRCSCCYLNITHSAAKHARGVACTAQES